METALLISQTGLTAILAAWLFLGVRDNILYPVLNLTFTAEVMQLTRMRDAFPDHYAMVAHRRVTNAKWHRAVFRLIVWSEIVVCLVLVAAVIWMSFACIGLADAQSARTAAMIGAFGFTSIWSAFLIGGNHFAYWYCHEGAQNTHFQMSIWGVGTMIFIVSGSPVGG